MNETLLGVRISGVDEFQSPLAPIKQEGTLWARLSFTCMKLSMSCGAQAGKIFERVVHCTP